MRIDSLPAIQRHHVAAGGQHIFHKRLQSAHLHQLRTRKQRVHKPLVQIFVVHSTPRKKTIHLSEKTRNKMCQKSILKKQMLTTWCGRDRRQHQPIHFVWLSMIILLVYVVHHNLVSFIFKTRKKEFWLIDEKKIKAICFCFENKNKILMKWLLLNIS